MKTVESKLVKDVLSRVGKTTFRLLNFPVERMAMDHFYGETSMRFSEGFADVHNLVFDQIGGNRG